MQPFEKVFAGLACTNIFASFRGCSRIIRGHQHDTLAILLDTDNSEADRHGELGEMVI
jgi:hypothetical protein